MTATSCVLCTMVRDAFVGCLGRDEVALLGFSAGLALGASPIDPRRHLCGEHQRALKVCARNMASGAMEGQR